MNVINSVETDLSHLCFSCILSHVFLRAYTAFHQREIDNSALRGYTFQSEKLKPALYKASAQYKISMSGNNTLNSLGQEIIVETPAAFAISYVSLSVAVLVLYDYFLTFPLELQYLWQSRMNITKTLYVVNRYFSLLDLYGNILAFFVKAVTNTECRAFSYMTEISSTLNAFAIASIFTLRTYAIYGRSRSVFLLLAIPGFGIVASSIWETVAQSSFALPLELQIGPWGCVSTFSSSFYTAELVNIISAATFDVLIVILTIYRTGRIAMQSREVRIKSLSFVLLRDGTLYYSAIFVPQFIIVVLDAVVLKSNNADLSEVTGILSSITNALQIVLVNRLVLNLSHAANAREDSVFRTWTGLEPPTFATGPYLGNIGGPVRTLPDSQDDEALGDNKNLDTDDNRGSTSVHDEIDIGGPSNDVQLDAGAESEEINV